MANFPIGKIQIGDNTPPLVVAEIGANHDGNAKKAELMLQEIAATGAKAVKFQTYTAEELVADSQRIITWGSAGKEQQERIGDLFQRLSLPREAHADLFQVAHELGLEVFSTPFSEKGVDFLMELNVPAFKVAASDVNHLPMLRHIAQTGKPVFLSLGKCTLAEADTAIATLFESGCRELCIMHCVAQYPSPMEEMNLRVIPTLATLYPECAIGFSDHSLGTTAAIAAVALGASVIEKHVTLNQDSVGPDHWFSLNMAQLHQLVCGVKDTYTALGHPRKRVVACEESERKTSVRSLVLRHKVAAGHRLQPEDIKIVRPGGGIAPQFLDTVLGMKVSADLAENTVLQWEIFK
ncbi:MAG: N-acetylneuraminate synthase family protein [Nostoc sp. ChiSLP02]|nr:N-acetylneuraminate synthase family protein [Nostoc sp. DedSLP05]MDZ8101616.1 N-acetylneuraminate synthase family protein [Nostoc sp. DedSLP01]MDZ8189548.1 N-acetylneuraminate synthase family protein [Nostoc sp. ChiSLP02]